MIIFVLPIDFYGVLVWLMLCLCFGLCFRREAMDEFYCGVLLVRSSIHCCEEYLLPWRVGPICDGSPVFFISHPLFYQTSNYFLLAFFLCFIYFLWIFNCAISASSVFVVYVPCMVIASMLVLNITVLGLLSINVWLYVFECPILLNYFVI